MWTRLPLLLALLALGCPPRSSGDTAPPAPRGPDAGAATSTIDAGPDAPLALTDDLPTLARRSAEMLEVLGDVLAVTPIDCVAFAEKVRAVLADHRDVRVASAAAVDRGDGAALDRALEPYAERIEVAATRMQPALTKCGNDAAFAEALTPFDVP